MPKKKPDPALDAGYALAHALKTGDWIAWSEWWAAYHDLGPEIADRFLASALAHPRRKLTDVQVAGKLTKLQKRALGDLDKAGLPRELRETAKRMVADGLAEVVDLGLVTHRGVVYPDETEVVEP